MTALNRHGAASDAVTAGAHGGSAGDEVRGRASVLNFNDINAEAPKPATAGAEVERIK